ncbi:MAG TPA: DUF4249 domain-containing protein [Hymenobacter sp.]|jgi:hypothetical protein
MRALSFSAQAALFWCLLLLLPGCVDPYMPEAISSTKSYLVVDGFINSSGVTTVNLSRTSDISAAGLPPTESAATVYIEEEAGTRYTLRESPVKGTYTSVTSLTLDAAKKYRLHILTAARKEYVSDYVPVKITPPIDAITWQPTEAGLTFYVSSHDDTNATQYYRWEYEQTWEIRPLVFPDLESVNNVVRPITVPYPLACWISGKSTGIKQSRTTSLERDVISNYPLHSLTNTTDQLYYKYSLLVKQHAQTKEEYEYWELLKKTTENIGTLFDPLPAEVTGNVHCLSDDTEIALGYIGAHSLQEKRIFVSRVNVPTAWRLQTGYEGCIPLDTIKVENVRNFFNDNIVPVGEALSDTGGLIGYTYSTPNCVDCRRRGTAVRPSFWQ